MTKLKFLIFAAIVSAAIIIGGIVIFDHQRMVTPPEEYKSMIKISSPAFKNGEKIPARFTCDGDNISPPLAIGGVPAAAKSLALIVDDPDAPLGDWTHWLVWNINPDIDMIEENSVPSGSVQGKNDFNRPDYGGPCPPSGVHRYQFKIFALDAAMRLDPAATKKDLQQAMSGHILDQGVIIGLYGRMK